MAKEILIIQEEEDKTFTYAIPELGIIATAPSADKALDVALGRIRTAIESPSIRRVEIESRLRELQIEKEELDAELAHLKASFAGREPIEAIELLEQIPMAKSLAEWFVKDTSLEKILGDIKCIAFAIGRDKDGDGDPECVPVIYSSRQIKTK